MGVLKDFNTSTVSHSKAVSGVSKFSIVQPGMAYRGTCRTRGCEGHGHSVICNRGHGNHLINDDIVNDIPKCPCCQAVFTVEDVLLFMCNAKVTVHTQTEEVSSLMARGDDIVVLGQRTKNEALFSNQRLVTIDTTGVGRGGGGGGCSIM
ncbi:Hypothetical protein, putative [Bodo saltans]|uniref:Uncharacterized protein n=1 Tax=Bodo saltans TaxID=75058 RepID=A0A0S4JB83_BODSA|nr:Hypothetical protein, putative [Bodo saltans]|eukprot:CUG88745.1 Hypothetical protein, putative [Bodo saltans]